MKHVGSMDTPVTEHEFLKKNHQGLENKLCILIRQGKSVMVLNFF